MKYPHKKWDIIYLIENNKITDFISLSKFKYLNEIIIEKYLTKQWDWQWIILNTDIKIDKFVSLELIKKYFNKWNYYELSKNPNLTEEFILKYLHRNWDMEYLIDNNKITDFNAISKFKYINKKIINKYPDKPWDWNWLLWCLYDDIENNNINLDIIEKNIKKINFYYLSYNPNLTKEFILKYPYQNWDTKYILKKFNINLKNKYGIISKCQNKLKDIDIIMSGKIKVDFEFLTKLLFIDQNIINKYPNKPWDWNWLLEKTDNIIEHNNINLDIIEKNILKINFYYLSYNPNLTENFIMKYPNKNWNIEYLIDNNKITDFKAFSRFKNINEKIINKYPDKKWDKLWLL